jgi:hypothetical protein
MARIYQTFDRGEAGIKASIVRHRGKADLCVHRVSSWGLARGDALWYITTNKQDANLWVYFDTYGAAQLHICFVDSYGEAGWLRPHALRGRLG